MKKTKAKILFLIAVLLELIGNFIISYTDGFTVLVPSVICFLIYSASAVFFGFSIYHSEVMLNPPSTRPNL